MPTPRESHLLIGHAAAESALIEAASGARMHHAWLIGGPPGIGKATLAYRFARWLLAAKPSTAGAQPSLDLDPSHTVFRRVAANTHADLLTIELEYDPKKKRQRTEIIADDVREVSNFLRLTPAEGGWRVVIVDGAEAMNRHGANALLKMLEEPPARAVLLLVSHAPGQLLPTLRSRCRALTLSPLAEAHMAQLLGHALPNLPAPDRTRLVALSDGSLGRALALAEAEGVALSDLAGDLLNALPDLGRGRIQAVADQLSRSDATFDSFMDLLRAALAKAVRAAARGAPDPLGAKLAALRPLDEWSDVWRALGRLQGETTHAYLDKRQAVVNALALLG